jgi:hypothetical protein
MIFHKATDLIWNFLVYLLFTYFISIVCCNARTCHAIPSWEKIQIAMYISYFFFSSVVCCTIDTQIVREPCHGVPEIKHGNPSNTTISIFVMSHFQYTSRLSTQWYFSTKNIWSTSSTFTFGDHQHYRVVTQPKYMINYIQFILLFTILILKNIFKILEIYLMHPFFLDFVSFHPHGYCKSLMASSFSAYPSSLDHIARTTFLAHAHLPPLRCRECTIVAHSNLSQLQAKFLKI